MAAGCETGGAALPPARHAEAARPEPPFLEQARELGLVFSHFNGMSGEFYFCEMMGAGGALFDYDNDGDLDAYLVQGQMLGPKPIDEATFPPQDPLPLRDRLFRNELIETGRLRFVDVTEASRIDSRGYGMGVAVGDYDADGWLDLYVTRFGPNLFLRSNGDGTFTEVTERTGTRVDLLSASAAFVDYDRDGRLDLFVTNYVDFTLANHKPCYSDTSARDYCAPRSYEPYPDRLFRNRGDGTFEDVTTLSQIARHYGAGLGVVSADLNADGLVDIFVANDGDPNQLWINRGDGTFRDDSLLGGCALSKEGVAEAGMGVDAGDFDNDGDEDLFITHLTGETNALFLNDGKGSFDDYRAESGLGPPSRPYTGFGTTWVDYDNDGWLDLIVANGAVRTILDLARAGDPYPLDQRNQIFHNRGDGSFEDVTAGAGPAFELVEVSRGAAFGDVDNDGDSDVLILNNSGPARLLVNQVGNRNHWLGLRLTDRQGKLDYLGTWVEVVRPDGSVLGRRVRVAASYLSSNDPRVLFGLGRDPAIARVRARWPDGSVEQWTGLPVDRYTTLKQGTGDAVSG